MEKKNVILKNAVLMGKEFLVRILCLIGAVLVAVGFCKLLVRPGNIKDALCVVLGVVLIAAYNRIVKQNDGLVGISKKDC